MSGIMESHSITSVFLTSTVFQPPVDRISSPPISEFIDRLELGKMNLDAILDKAELKAYGNKQVKKWVDELSEVSYDVKDLLDEIEKKPRSYKIWVRLINFSANFIPLEETRKQRLMAKAAKIDDLQTKIDALGLREAFQIKRGRFQRSVGREDFEDESQVFGRDEDESQVFGRDEDESQVFGRDEDKEAILKLLFSDDNHQTDVITMVGEDGVGKTTLAQFVFNDEKVEKQFEVKAWIHVSEDFDDLLLTKAILHAFNYPSDTEDLDSLQNSLKDLKKKKFLLVLDNLAMRSDRRNLQKVLTDGANGSRIIVTTCHPQLEETMAGTLPAFTVRSLEDQESWMLFAKHAFPDKDYSLHLKLEEIGKEIVEKCRGLPLAVKILASVLRFKHEVKEWQALLNNINSIVKWDEDPLSSILKMCYNDLPIHLKRCAAYFSIFPAYHEYEEDKIILLWMAQGFLQQKEGTTMEEVGSEYFHNLTDRSFFQPSGAKKSCFIMHDLLKDVIRSESGFICSRMGNGEYPEVSSKLWHLLICGGKDVAERSKEAKFLRTLILCKSSREKKSCQLSVKQLNNLFKALQCLRVLSLSGYDITKLPDSIGKLKRLRFLDLSHTAITRLSDSVSSLYNLQTLLLSNCSRLTRLPDSSSSLRNLRFLDLSHTAITKLPNYGVHSLKELQTVLLSHCSCLTEFPSSLQNLTNLRCIDLSHTAITEIPFDSLKNLDKLQKLLLSHCTRLTELPDLFHYLTNLQFIDISHTAITKLPDSVSFLPNLQIVFPENRGKLINLRPLYNRGEFPDSNVVQRTDVSITSKIPPPESSKRLTEDSSDKHGGASDNYSAATEISSSDTDNPINAEESLEDIETSKSSPPESPKHMTEDSSAKHGGASTATEISYDIVPINAEESLEDIETSKSPPPESPKHMTEDSSAKHGGASTATEISYDIVPINAEESLEDNETSKSPPPESPKHLTEDSSAKHVGASAATEISSDTDTDDPIDAEEILEDISSPEQESLDVSEISQLKRLPPKLYSLKLEGCDALKSLQGKLKHDNPYLQHLYIIDCHFLESIHESHLPIALKTLYISKSKKLEFLSSEYTSIEHLCIESSWDSLKSFPLAYFPNLRNLSILDCANFTSISIGLKDHMSLDALEIRDCPKLTSFLERGLRLPNLTSILLSDCKNLKELPDQLHRLTSLQSLFMKECPELESIPGGLPSSLNLLCISSCHKLTPRVDWGLHKLNSFSCIEIEGGCRDLESFPEQNLLPMNLTSLRISRLMNLKFLDYKGLEHLTSLETLKINSCGKLQSFPAEGLPSSLSYLYISDCPLLKSKLQNRRGKEWYKIAHIPHIQIDMEVIS